MGGAESGNKDTKIKDMPVEILRPLSDKTYWKCVMYDRTTKTGIKMTYIKRLNCPWCRKSLDLERKKLELLASSWADAERQGRDTVKLSKAYGKQESLVRNLQQHQDWWNTQRPFMKAIQRQLQKGELPGVKLVFQDYVKFYANNSDAIKTLNLSMISNNPEELLGETLLTYADHFFKGSSYATTAIRIWEFMLSNTDTFDDVDKIVISGDTGNGFRGYDLLYFFSTVWDRIQKIIEQDWLCPRHAFGPCDRRGGHLGVVFDEVQHSAELNTPEEFARVATRLSNETAYYHPDGIDGKNPKLQVVDEASFSVPEMCRPRGYGVERIGRAQYRWPLPDKTLFSAPGVLRVQPYSSDDADWVIWDLRVTGRSNCERCTAVACKPTAHPGESCPHESKVQYSDDPHSGVRVAAVQQVHQVWICACGYESIKGFDYG